MRILLLSWWRVLGLMVAVACGFWWLGAHHPTLSEVSQVLGLLVFGLWTSPKTWTAVVVTVSDLNTHIRDNLTILKTWINDDGSLRAFGLLDRVFTEQSVSSTTTETSVYSYSIAGGTFSTNNIIRLVLTGYIDLSAVSRTLTLRVKFGATTIGTATLCTTASTKGTVRIEVIINANNATNSQRATILLTSVTDNATTTDGNLDANYTLKMAGHSSLAEDTTSAKTLQVTVQWSGADATAIFKRWAAWTEKLKAA